MPRPHHYYFHPVTSEQEHTTNQTGLLDVDYLLQDKPNYWLRESHTGSGAGGFKKCLILNDFTAKNWSTYKRLNVQEHLQTLIQEGFQIFLGDTDLTPISELTCFEALNDYCDTLPYCLDETLLSQATVLLNKPRRELLCLNYFEINALLYGTNSESHIILTQDIRHNNQVCDETDEQWSLEKRQQAYYRHKAHLKRWNIQGDKRYQFLLPEWTNLQRHSLYQSIPSAEPALFESELSSNVVYGKNYSLSGVLI